MTVCEDTCMHYAAIVQTFDYPGNFSWFCDYR